MIRVLVLALSLAACNGGGLAIGSGGAAISCAEINDAPTCRERTDCHAVYEDPGTCDCVPGCCTKFSFCAAGRAQCTNTGVLCRAAPPDCEGSYVVSYANSCFEGCVLKSDCK